uniref:Uncharacterized protein n=2 Tax=Anguilla anguilla TaxID=7936 RepID=A0A0E9S7P5_ANGAN
MWTGFLKVLKACLATFWIREVMLSRGIVSALLVGYMERWSFLIKHAASHSCCTTVLYLYVFHPLRLNNNHEYVYI